MAPILQAGSNIFQQDPIFPTVLGHTRTYWKQTKSIQFLLLLSAHTRHTKHKAACKHTVPLSQVRPFPCSRICRCVCAEHMKFYRWLFTGRLIRQRHMANARSSSSWASHLQWGGAFKYISPSINSWQIFQIPWTSPSTAHWNQAIRPHPSTHFSTPSVPTISNNFQPQPGYAGLLLQLMGNLRCQILLALWGGIWLPLQSPSPEYPTLANPRIYDVRTPRLQDMSTPFNEVCVNVEDATNSRGPSVEWPKGQVCHTVFVSGFQSHWPASMLKTQFYLFQFAKVDPKSNMVSSCQRDA